MPDRSIRTLFIVKMPYPPIGGEHLRSWQNINILSQLGPVTVFSIFRYDYDSTMIKPVESWHSYNVNSQPFPWSRIEPIIWWLRKIGLWDYWPYRYTAAEQIDRTIAEFKPDLIVIEELWLYHYLSVAKRHGCPIIFDHHNVEALLFQATKCKAHGLRGWLRSKLHLPQIKADERDFMHQVNQTWVCSHDDQQILQQLYGDSPDSYVVPNAINLDYYKSIRLGQCSLPVGLQQHNRYILFMGNFGYIPNAEAVEILITQIYPRLKPVYPDCQLLLVGRDPTPLMLKAGQANENITVTGQVPDVRPYLAASSIMVVPLLKGSGTRFKILEAFAAHRPVVSTTKGAEGLHVTDGQQLLIRDNVDALTSGIIQLWQDSAQAQALTSAGYELVQADYSWEAARRAVRVALRSVLPNMANQGPAAATLDLRST